VSHGKASTICSASHAAVGCRVTEPKQLAPTVTHDKERKQAFKCQGWHHAEINRRDCLGMIRQECPPGFGGGLRGLIMYLVKSLRSKAKVTNKKNGHAVTFTITDRKPYVKGRCIDLSKAGAGALGFAGLAPVSVVPVVSD
jgi:Lytic transglycolase